MRAAEKGKRVDLRKRKEIKKMVEEEEEDGSDDGEQPTFHFSLPLIDHHKKSFSRLRDVKNYI